MSETGSYAHQPVMLEEVLELLPTDDNGFYVDGTFGRGGHSRALLDHLGPRALLVGVDRDPEAVSAGRELAGEDPRFRMVAGRFDCLDRVVPESGRELNGLLLDLGVSSPQLEDPDRGFSFRNDGPLDMRMDPSQGESAAEWLARAPEKEIADVLYHYGEERRSRQIARRICERRREHPLARTGELAELIAGVRGTGSPGRHPATRSFQALRIYLNRELEALENILNQALEWLAPGGRLVVISFHSLEDRIVKHFIREHSGRAPRGRGGLPAQNEPPVRLAPPAKPRHAGPDEVAANPRARSAVLRMAEKVAA